jgi:hypothetical protein
MFFLDIEGKNGNNTSIIALFILLQQPLILLKYLVDDFEKQMNDVCKNEYRN